MRPCKGVPLLGLRVHPVLHRRLQGFTMSSLVAHRISKSQPQKSEIAFGLAKEDSRNPSSGCSFGRAESCFVGLFPCLLVCLFVGTVFYFVLFAVVFVVVSFRLRLCLCD